jgi:hypothetical protein
MSQSSKTSKGTMHAVLHETEPGLYRAEYSGELNPEDPDAREFPDSHIGTDADGVRQWVESMAANLGYDKVVWDSPDQA